MRAQTLRATIHLHTAADCLAIQPVTQSVLDRTFRSSWARRMGGVDPAPVAAAGAALLAARADDARGAGPAARAALARGRAGGARPGGHVPLRPRAGAAARAVAARRARPAGRPRARSWTAGALRPRPPTRWSSATSPRSARRSTADLRTWCGLTGLRPVVERLRPGLRTFRDEHGRELLDVPDGLLPDPDTPAPPRFLPEYDNLRSPTRTARGSSPGSGRASRSRAGRGSARCSWTASTARTGASPRRATARR